MSGGLVAAECTACGRVTFPRRLWCPACGGPTSGPRTIETGTVEETTTVERAAGRADWVPVRIGAVRLDAGQVVVVGLDAGVEVGERVRLEGGAAPAATRGNLPRRERADDE